MYIVDNKLSGGAKLNLFSPGMSSVTDSITDHSSESSPEVVWTMLTRVVEFTGLWITNSDMLLPDNSPFAADAQSEVHIR